MNFIEAIKVLKEGKKIQLGKNAGAHIKFDRQVNRVFYVYKNEDMIPINITDLTPSIIESNDWVILEN